MALKAIVPNLEEVPEQYHDLYTERNGQFEFTGVEGVKTQADVDRLQSALTKERNDHKDAKGRLALLGDRKIEDVLTQLDRIPELEAAAQGHDEDKIHQLVEARIKGKMAPLERELGELRKANGEQADVITGYQSRERTRTIGDSIRRAAKEMKVLPEALEDALMYERAFEIDEAGNVVTRDESGFTPGVDAKVWLTDMQTKRPHWWGPSQGGGAGGNRGGGLGGGENPWSADGWNMTKQGMVLKENRTRAEQLAKAAGTTIGGPRPQPKQ